VHAGLGEAAPAPISALWLAWRSYPVTIGGLNWREWGTDTDDGLPSGGQMTALRRSGKSSKAILLALLLIGGMLTGLASTASATVTLSNGRFFPRPTVAPNLAAVGGTLSWDAVDPTNSYVLRRKIAGQAAEYALVKGDSALPPIIPESTVSYAVMAILGGPWSSEVSITYPSIVSADLATFIGEEGLVELREGRFVERAVGQPQITVAGETLSWSALDPTNSYVLRRKLPNHQAEYALVKSTSALPPAIEGSTVVYTVKAAIGGLWSPEVSVSYPGSAAEEETAPEPDCALYASPEGSDGGPGSLAAPLRTVKELIRRLSAGETGCLMSGRTFNGSFTLYDGDSHGEAHEPVTITSTDPTRPATIYGRIVTEGGADWLSFTHLKLRWKEELGLGLPQITVGSSHTTWRYDDVENANTAICFNAIASLTYGTANYTLIDHDRIHDCGGPYPYISPTATGYMSHGVYAIGNHTVITNNYLYHEANRGVQLRGSQGAIVEHNIIDDNGSGIVFGDLGASNNEVAYNIITNSTRSINGCCNVYGVFSWWGTGAVGTGNTFHNNCLYGNDDGNVNTSGGGFTATENMIANPRYVEAATHDYTLQPASPCLGYGPDSAQP
jgi:hypothetical protein